MPVPAVMMRMMQVELLNIKFVKNYLKTIKSKQLSFCQEICSTLRIFLLRCG